MQVVLSQALVHFVIARASLLSDHRICGLPTRGIRVTQQVPQVHYTMPCVQYDRTVRALNFRRDLAHLQVLHILHVVDHILRILPEWIANVILRQICL